MPHSSLRDPFSMSVPPRSGQSCHWMKSQSPFTQPAPLSAPGCPLLPRPHAVPSTHQASGGAGASFWDTRLPDSPRLLFSSLMLCPACIFSGLPPSISRCCSLPPAHSSSRILPTCWTGLVPTGRARTSHKLPVSFGFLHEAISLSLHHLTELHGNCLCLCFH